MSFPSQSFYFFIIFFLVFFNQLSNFLFFCQAILFFTSNECFSHFNVQQLLSNRSHVILFSQVYLKITFKTKTFEKKSISFDFIEFRILRYVLHCSIFFGARLENPKINKRGCPNNSGGEGEGEGGRISFFKKKIGERGDGVYAGP